MVLLLFVLGGYKANCRQVGVDHAGDHVLRMYGTPIYDGNHPYSLSITFRCLPFSCAITVPDNGSP